MRTVIVLSALSETTTPWRSRPCRCRCARRAGCPRGGRRPCASRGSWRASGGAAAAFLRRRSSALGGALLDDPLRAWPRRCAASARACAPAWARAASGSASSRHRSVLGCGLARLSARAPRSLSASPPASGVSSELSSRSSVSSSCFSCLLLSDLGLHVEAALRAIVRPRARSFLAFFSPAVFSSCPVACWKRRLKSSWRDRSTNSTSCGSSRLCTSTPFTAVRPPRASRTWS